MPPSRSRTWLDHILAGESVTDQDIKKLVAECPQEDQYLDYKAGALLQDKKKAADVLREYVTAFANSDGGILLIGYDQKSQAFDGATAPGGGTLEEWVTRCLSSLAPQFSPVPRVRSLDVDGKPVLIVATPRSPILIHLPRAGSLVCHLRIGDSTLEAPPYLVTDLVLGRRNQPVLKPMFRVPIEPQGPWDSHVPNVSTIELRLLATIENESLVFADDVRCGIVTWAAPRVDPGPEDRQRVASSLRARIDVKEPEQSACQSIHPRWQLLHLRWGWPISGPTPGQHHPFHIGPLEESAQQPFAVLGLPVFRDSDAELHALWDGFTALRQKA